jgi:RNA polymerase sigma-B factor
MTAEAPAVPRPAATPAGDDYTEVEDLFTRLAEAVDDAERRRWRCQIIIKCLPLADHIAHRYVGRGEPGEDLIQIARLALVQVVDRYRPGSGTFLPFAIPTIMGEVRRHFRDNGWMVHVPRPLKETHRRMRASIDPLSQRLGRAPTAGELAVELGLAREDIAQCIGIAYAYRPCSLDAALPGAARTALASHGAEDPRYDCIEDELTIAELVSRLSERERELLRMRFCEGLSQTQIARRLGVSQVHVSRRLAATLDRLRRLFWAA